MPPKPVQHEYLLALLDSSQTKLFPVCLVLDGPMGYSPSSTVSGNNSSSSSSSNNQPETLVAIKISKDVPAQRDVLKEIFTSKNLTILTMVGLSSLCMMSSFCGRNNFRTMCRNTSLVLSSYVRIVAQQNVNKQATTVNGQHDIDVDGELKMVLDHEVAHLYLTKGTLYLDGQVAATTADSSHIEHLYKLERQTQMCYSLSPAVLTRNQLANSFDSPQQQQQQQQDSDLQQSQQQQQQGNVQFQAKIVRNRLSQRFQGCGIQPSSQQRNFQNVGPNMQNSAGQGPGMGQDNSQSQQQQQPLQPPQPPREPVPLAENSPLVHSILGSDRENTEIYYNTTIDLPTLPVRNTESALEITTKFQQIVDCDSVTPQQIFVETKEREKSMSLSKGPTPNITASDLSLGNDRSRSSGIESPGPNSNPNQQAEPPPPPQPPPQAMPNSNGTNETNINVGNGGGQGIAVNVEHNTVTTTQPNSVSNDSESAPPSSDQLVDTNVKTNTNTTQVQGVLESENSSGAKRKLNVKIKTITTTTAITETFTKSCPNIEKAQEDGASGGGGGADAGNTTNTTATTNVTVSTNPELGSGSQQQLDSEMRQPSKEQEPAEQVMFR